jgi:translation initiation factor 5B
MNIELYDESEWMNFVERMKELAKKKTLWEERIKAQKILEEQQQEAERQRLKAETERLQEEKRKQEEEARKMQEERDALILERTGARHDQLKSIGLIASLMHNGDFGYVRYDKSFVPMMNDEQIKNATSSQWSILMDGANQAISVLKQEEEAEIEAAKAAESQRLEKMRQDALAKAEADLKAKKEEEQRLEKERMEQMSDKEKIAHYVGKVQSIEKPVLKTAKWNKAMSQYVLYLNALAEMK